jgi:hypothetical protein
MAIEPLDDMSRLLHHDVTKVAKNHRILVLGMKKSSKFAR